MNVTLHQTCLFLWGHTLTPSQNAKASFPPGNVCRDAAHLLRAMDSEQLAKLPMLHHETSSIKRTEFKDRWILICGRFSREPVNYKILHCALPTKSWAVRFNCSSSFIFCTISCDSFMIFKINYKICHLRTYILVWDINTSILYSQTFSPIFILVKESRMKTMTQGRESFHKRDFKKKPKFWSLSSSVHAL